MKRFQGKTVVREQLLDGNQLQRLSLTLGRPRLRSDVDVTQVTPQQGTPIPPGYHLIYFTPANLESSLGPDGTDQTYNAPPPFTRRMWAGGSMQWEAGNQLAVGDEVAEHTTLVQAQPKRGRDGTEMIFVEVLKEFSNARGLALVDKRYRHFPRSEKGISSVAQADRGSRSLE
jgi:hydroxyacyl-ACP dehydratase HTD2-like protein with hotdog domain